MQAIEIFCFSRFLDVAPADKLLARGGVRGARGEGGFARIRGEEARRRDLPLAARECGHKLLFRLVNPVLHGDIERRAETVHHLVFKARGAVGAIIAGGRRGPRQHDERAGFANILNALRDGRDIDIEIKEMVQAEEDQKKGHDPGDAAAAVQRTRHTRGQGGHARRPNP